MDKLEAVHNIALVAAEEETTPLQSSLLLQLLTVKLRTEGNTTANDATGLSGDWRVETFQVKARIGLAHMSREWAAILSLRVLWEVVSEVVVPLRVRAESRIILQWSKIQRRTYI